MPNPYVNKVVQSNGTTLIDISDTTAVAADVASGKYFYLATGEKVEGTASGGGGSARTTIVPEQTINVSTAYNQITNYNSLFVEGEEYICTVNGVEYVKTAEAEYGSVNIHIDGWDIYFEKTASDNVFFNVENSAKYGTYTIKVEQESGGGGGGDATLITRTITANGTYSASDDSADGYSSVTVNVPSGSGSDFPKFTVTYDPSTGVRVSGVCDKTFAQCLDYIDAGKAYGELTEVWDASYSAYGTVTWFGQGDDYVIYTAMNGTSPMYDIRYNSDGTIVFTEPSANNVILNITQNGTTYPTGVVTEVNVNVPLNVNVQTAQSTTRRNNTTLGSITSLTCSTEGTYDVYWSCARSNTSQTWGSQLYINGSAYGTENTTWSNNVQNNHLTGVVLSANDTVAVYGRSRSGYYIYVPQLTIVQTS